jgi:hypothetical protein
MLQYKKGGPKVTLFFSLIQKRLPSLLGMVLAEHLIPCHRKE